MSTYLADYLNALVPGSTEFGEVLAAARKLLFPKIGGKTPQWRQVTNRVGVSSTYAAGVTTQMSRNWQISHVPLRALKVGWWNGGVDTANARGGGSGKEAGPGGPATLVVSVEYPLGTFTQLTFAVGGVTGTAADNAIIETDGVDLGFTIPPFRKFRIAMYVACASGTWNRNYNNACDRSHGDEFQFGGSNNTMNASVQGTGTTSGALPHYVLGLSDLGVWGMVGDSLLSSLGEADFFDPSGGIGFLGRGIAPHFPLMNYGVAGDRADWFVSSHGQRIAGLVAGGVTRMIDEYAINDFNVARTSAGLLADKASIRSYITGIPWFEVTCQPKTTGTFDTAAGQTIWNAGANTERVTHNNALRAGISGVEDVIDIASQVETSTSVEVRPVKDGGVWLGGYSSDGTHQAVKGAFALQPYMINFIGIHGA